MQPPPSPTLTPFMHMPDCYDTSSSIFDISCDDLRTKIIALRVYFILIIINFLFVVLTTSYYLYRNLTAKWHTIDPYQSVSKMWQIYSLKKRSLFDTVLGAIGHLIFSSTVLLYQVFVSSFTCDIYLFGPLVGFYIWTYAIIWRTIRLHLIIRVNQLQQRFLESTCENQEQTKDYIWFQKHKDRLNVSTKIHVLIFLSTLLVIVVTVILAEILGIRKYGCSTRYGNHVIFALIIFFFVVVVPFIFWHLRHDDDTHGIRREIWITLSVGVPCFVVFVVWQVVFEAPTTSKPAVIRGIFGPANWIVIVTTTSHIMSMTPLFKRLSNAKMDAREETFASQGFELTTECLEQALEDPRKRRILQTWAVKDFSVENILFYEKYLGLARKVQNRIDRNSALLSTPFCANEMHDLVDFYNTFITDQAPLQINISYQARSGIDTALASLAGTQKEPFSGIPRCLRDHNYTVEYIDLKDKNRTDQVEDTLDMSHLSLEIFETARKEIFWNIFSGLFPKVVAASH